MIALLIFHRLLFKYFIINWILCSSTLSKCSLTRSSLTDPVLGSVPKGLLNKSMWGSALLNKLQGIQCLLMKSIVNPATALLNAHPSPFLFRKQGSSFGFYLCRLLPWEYDITVFKFVIGVSFWVLWSSDWCWALVIFQLLKRYALFN